ncbi:MAG: glycosyltransferase family 2 protein [Metamycoplasmataceae bacterium]
MLKKISILIPCYNGEKTIKKCLNSVLKQTYTNLEIIVVNDGSTDSSQKIIEEMMNKNNNIKLINQENKGLTKTRNILIENAKNEYFFFLDSDDFIDETLIQNFVDELNINPDSDLILNTCFLNKNNKSKLWYVCGKFKKNFTKEEYLASNAIFAWNILYKTDFIKNNNLSFNEVYPFFEDCGTLNYWIALSKKVSVINKPGYHYVFVKNSLSKERKMSFEKINGSIEQYLGLVKNLDKIFNNNYPIYINNQLAFYRSILHTYIFFQSNVNKIEKKDLKNRFKEIEKRKLKYPKCFWMFWYYFLTKIVR